MVSTRGRKTRPASCTRRHRGGRATPGNGQPPYPAPGRRTYFPAFSAFDFFRMSAEWARLNVWMSLKRPFLSRTA